MDCTYATDQMITSYVCSGILSILYMTTLLRILRSTKKQKLLIILICLLLTSNIFRIVNYQILKIEVCQKDAGTTIQVFGSLAIYLEFTPRNLAYWYLSSKYYQLSSSVFSLMNGGEVPKSQMYFFIIRWVMIILILISGLIPCICLVVLLQTNERKNHLVNGFLYGSEWLNFLLNLMSLFFLAFSFNTIKNQLKQTQDLKIDTKMEILNYISYVLFALAILVNIIVQQSNLSNQADTIGIIFVLVISMVSQLLLAYIFNLMYTLSQDVVEEKISQKIKQQISMMDSQTSLGLKQDEELQKSHTQSIESSSQITELEAMQLSYKEPVTQKKPRLTSLALGAAGALDVHNMLDENQMGRIQQQDIQMLFATIVVAVTKEESLNSKILSFQQSGSSSSLNPQDEDNMEGSKFITHD